MLGMARTSYRNARFHTLSEPAAHDDDLAGVNPALRVLEMADSEAPGPRPGSLLGSYRRLADVFHDILASRASIPCSTGSPTRSPS